MTQIVSNIIQNSLSGFVAGAVTTVGGYTGDAIAALGNFVEQKGDAVGDGEYSDSHKPFWYLLIATKGIAKKFDSWGQGVASYGGKPKTISSTQKVVQEQKTNIGQKKQLPSSGVKKSLPSAPSTQKRLPAPAKAGTVTAKAGSKTVKPQYPRANSDTTVVSRKKDQSVAANKPATANRPSTAFAKPKTTASGKVIPAKSSLSQNKARSSLTSTTAKPASGPYKGPIPLGEGKSAKTDFKPHGGYQGPLNLGSLGNAGQKPSGQANTSTKSSAKPASSNSAMKAGRGQAKAGAGGYKGPLELGSLA
jgi:hypothetical protein